MNITLSENKPQEIISLFNFFMGNIFNQTPKKVNFKAKAKIFFNNKNESEKAKIKDELKALSFYDVNNYSVKLQQSEDEIFELMQSLSKFREELLNDLNVQEVKINFEPIERKVSPSLEAYEYVGMNKLDITPSDRSYGLLFE